MVLKLSNNATTTTAVAIGTGDTSVTVATDTGALFPIMGAGDYFYATMQTVTNAYEIVRVTARVNDTMTIVRAQEGTLAIPIPANSRFEIRVTVQNIASVLEDLNYLLL